MTIDEALIDALRQKDVVLFVGAGLSRNLGLPSFSELMGKLATDLGYDPELFRQLGDAPTLAEYYYLQKRGLGGLRTRLDEAWHDSTISVDQSRSHQLVVALGCRVIYTTNWDTWLERAHEAAGIRFHRIVGVADMTDIPDEAVQIVKFHGDFADDDSLVLTESSYMRRMDLTSPLDIRLRNDAMGKSLLFIGYSLRDPNTRLLLHKLNELWKGTPYASAQPKSFLISDHPNPVQETVLGDWGVRTVVAERREVPGEGLEEVLAELVRRATDTVLD